MSNIKFVIEPSVTLTGVTGWSLWETYTGNRLVPPARFLKCSHPDYDTVVRAKRHLENLAFSTSDAAVK
jgi:hypothetical protein